LRALRLALASYSHASYGVDLKNGVNVIFPRTRGAILSPAEIDAAADYLLRIRIGGEKIVDLPGSFRPGSLDEAYAIQRRLVAKFPASSVGWFVALTSPEMQSVHRAPGPIYGRILRSNLHRSPGVVLLRDSERSVTVEAEYAFRMARDLTPGLTYTESVVAGAIRSVVPMLEFVDSIFEDMTAVGVASLIADNGADGQIVLGQDCERLSPAELLTDPVRVSVNGVPVAEGHPSNVMGGPLRVLTWFVNERTKGGQVIREGEIVGTGNCLQRYCYGRAGDGANADFGSLGSVSVTLAA
jgi:2-keto-4-pentenoate hydratase